MADPRKSIFDAIRASRGTGFTAFEVGRIDAFLTAIGVPVVGAVPTAKDPPWVIAGRTKIGEREIAGPAHSAFILSFWKGTKWEGILRTDDSDSPWCGGFQKWCMEQAGIAYPADFPRAAAWATWGVPMKEPAVGTIGVKARTGGNHVFAIVGQTSDGKFYKVLEGNANNMVRIGDIAKSDVTAMRWPSDYPMPASRTLPVMAKGVIATSEG